MPVILNTARRSAAITSTGSGLGREIALGLTSKGYKVFCTAFPPLEVAAFESVNYRPKVFVLDKVS
jgi:NAD(P)-dependent dehydrogenase (short-subunit alcohol dehydrogenase family)